MTTVSSSSSTSSENFAALFEESLSRQEMRIGEVITAEVVRVDYNIVVVNAGLKSESFIPVEEFKNDRGEIEVKPGDFISVAIESLEDGFGETRLSRDKAKRLTAWHDLEEAMESGKIVTGMVNGKVKGGLTAMINGIRAFLPGSLVDIRPVKDTTPYENKEMEFKSSNWIVNAKTSLFHAAPCWKPHKAPIASHYYRACKKVRLFKVSSKILPIMVPSLI